MIEYASKPGKPKQQAAMQWLMENCEEELRSGDVAGCCEKIARSVPQESLDHDGKSAVLYVLDNLCEGQLLESLGDTIPGHLFEENKRLKAVTIPSNIKSIDDAAFDSCNNLTSITFAEGVTDISDWAFAYCIGLTSINIPDSVKNIGDWAFYKCTGLTDVTIGNGLLNIRWGAFFECTALTSVTIPDSVANIGASAFWRCRNLAAINYGGTREQWQDIHKGKDWDDSTGPYIIHCSDGDLGEE